MTSQEQRPHLNNLDVLQNGRYEAAVNNAERQARHIFANNQLTNPSTCLDNMSNSWVPYEYNVMSATRALELDGLGVDLHQLTDTMSGAERHEIRPVETIEAGDEQLKVNAFGNHGFSLVFTNKSTKDNDVHPKALTELIAARYAHSPGHRALAAVHDRIKDQPELSTAVITTEVFDPAEDLLGTLVFLQGIDAVDDRPPKGNEWVHNLTAADLLDQIKAMPAYRGTVTETDDAYIANFGDQAKKQLTINKQTGFYQLSVTPDVAYQYLESPNQSHSNKSVPFIETAAAADLCQQLDAVGLMFHPQLQYEMMSTKEADRYGNVYTQMTREVAKWINNPGRANLSNLFVPINDEFYGQTINDKTKYFGSGQSISYAYKDTVQDDAAHEMLVRSRWSQRTGAHMGEAATVLMEMVDEALSRSVDQPQPSDLPVTQQQIAIRDGACFDVSSYYVGAASMFNLTEKEVNGVTLLEKTMGNHTFLTTQDIQFNGVRLPKGALLSQYDDGWAFLRLTPFAFDTDEDQLAFGSEMAKTLANEVAALQHIGGTSLAHLMSTVKKLSDA